MLNRRVASPNSTSVFNQNYEFTGSVTSGESRPILSTIPIMPYRDMISSVETDLVRSISTDMAVPPPDMDLSLVQVTRI